MICRKTIIHQGLLLVFDFSISGLGIDDFLKSNEKSKKPENSALTEINAGVKESKRTILDEITFENYSYYLGFDKLK